MDVSVVNGSIHLKNWFINSKFGTDCSYVFPSVKVLNLSIFMEMETARRFRSLKSHKTRSFRIFSMKEAQDQRLTGGVLTNDLQFEPAFGEYLKAMESAKTKRDKNLSRERERHSFKNRESEGNLDVLESDVDENRCSRKGISGNSAKERTTYDKSSSGFEIQTEYSRDRSVSNVLKDGNVRDKWRRDMGQNGSLEVAKDRSIREVTSRELRQKENLNARIEMGSSKITRGNWRHRENLEKNLKPTISNWEECHVNHLSTKTSEQEVKKGVYIRRQVDGNLQEPSRIDRNIPARIEQNIHEKLIEKYETPRGKPYDGISVYGTDTERHGSIIQRIVRHSNQSLNRDEHRRPEKKYGGKSEVLKNKETRMSRRFTTNGALGNDLEMERQAFKSFEVFTDVNNRPRVLRMEMEERIQKLVKWLNGTDVNLPEWQFSKMMHSAGIKFTDHSILRVIRILGDLGNWRRTLQVIQWLESHERFKSYKSRYIYTTALDVLGKARRPVEALNVFHAMREQVSSYPDMPAYHCIAVILGQAGYMKELFDVIDCMRAGPQKKMKSSILDKWDPRLEPDLVIYNAVLNACVQQKQWEGAFWVLQQLKQRNIQPSSTTCGLVMEVMLACEKYSLVYEFFKKVEKSSVPNTLTYKVLVNALWKEGKTEEAVLAVQDMERRGIVGSASLYYDLARCLCSAGRCQEALLQVEKICKVANKPLVMTFTGLMQTCLEVGNVKDGEYIFRHMQKYCSPNIVTCNIVLKSYAQNGFFKEAKDLFQAILDGGAKFRGETDRERLLPDKCTFNTMLEACSASKQWDDIESVYMRMVHHGYQFDLKYHLRLVLEASRAGKGRLLCTACDHLVQSGRKPPVPIFKERFCNALHSEDYGEAISCAQSLAAIRIISKKAWLDLFYENSDRFSRGSIVGLLDKVKNTVKDEDNPCLTLQNLADSCREFVNAKSITDSGQGSAESCGVEEKSL
ncbi:pentatricopeptide repeat-containing protein At1g30610, chloroplastic [Amborella trichopoda]|uniref:Pentacotripeptide-repeat region of PRORP domain-containing protein n=1 Tax=Amborella trichopoda TaxID=13333 RepID=W1PJ35_AMBTC|nr:pentatricopeptide repeat-containing protein At1g30610, chloroplastic [Amborella trichopoda]ERN07656.1 hypothetical protein AMTR_s00155p00027590 [Amborella trichopoda]|eukprot:XP_006845981.3 pentatricopeptide repeat-containing protein At1g30610, chloroplastic [Amborella trichopoda]